jgi:hypothetical protein
MVPIKWRDVLVAGTGHHSASGEMCYCVLTDRYFGWRRSALPVNFRSFFPAEYEVIPISSIRQVEVTPLYYTSHANIRIYWDGAKAEPEVFEVGRVMTVHLWVTAFQKLGIAVVGAEEVSLTSLRGFLNNYGMWIWAGIFGIGGFFTFALSGPNALRNAYFFNAFFAIATIVLLLWLRRRARQGGQREDS